MGLCQSFRDESLISNKNSENYQLSFRCTYFIYNMNNEIRIINDRGFIGINHVKNKEIKSKIKILNNNIKENLIFKKNFLNMDLIL